MKHNTTASGCIRWLGLCGILFGLLHIFSAVNMFRTANEVPLSLPIIGLLLIFWATLFVVVGTLLIMGRSNGILMGARLMLLYLVVETLRAILFAQSDYDLGRITFRVIAAALVAIIPLTYLAIHHNTQRDRHHGENSNGN